MGPAAVLLDELDLDPADWAEGLRSLAPEGLLDVVPAASTVLVRCESPRTLAGAIASFDRVEGVAVAAPIRSVVEIEVDYDGPDLGDVASEVGLTTDEVITAHQHAEFIVAFCGFAPGFGYLRGLPPELHLPRRVTPRTRVPAGSVAIASEFSAVYPSESPGGWHLLGSTAANLFDVDRDPPALLTPGTAVRFVAA